MIVTRSREEPNPQRLKCLRGCVGVLGGGGEYPVGAVHTQLFGC